MFVAFMLHEAGTSTPSCSKATCPVAIVGDPRIAPLPDDLVVRVDGRRGEMPSDAEPRPLRNDGHDRCLQFLSAFEHKSPHDGGVATRTSGQTTTYCGWSPTAPTRCGGHYSTVVTVVSTSSGPRIFQVRGCSRKFALVRISKARVDSRQALHRQRMTGGLQEAVTI